MKIRTFVFSLFLTAFLSSATGNENFNIIGSRIFDPEGNEFIPKGVNVQGITEPPYEYIIQALEAGRYNFKAIAVDNADNESVSTNISVNVRKSNSSGIITITIIDQNGVIREVLVNEFHTPGIYSVNFKPGDRYPGGIYYYQIGLNKRYLTKHLVIQ